MAKPLTLGISTSSGQFALVLGEAGKVLYNSEWSGALPEKKEVHIMLTEGLQQLQRNIHDIGQIITDIGPGGTSCVRTGVSFVNSLSFSMGIPVSPVSSFELAGADVHERTGLLVVSTVKSIKDNAFIGLYNGPEHYSIHFGKISELLPELVNETDEFAVVGYHREEIINLFPAKKIHDTGLRHGNLEVLITQGHLFAERSINWPKIAIPVNEQNIVV